MIRGNSGCSINIIGNKLYKTAEYPYSLRLKKQIEKQKKFSNPIINSPKILNSIDDYDKFSAEMEFIPSKDCIGFFLNSSKFLIDGFTKKISNYIENNILSSIESDVSSIVIEKIKNIRFPEKYSDFASKIKFPVIVPVGECHGDLTFSNILFSNNNIYFIDFLDSFIESPLIDMVKIRQDSFFGWSLNLYNTDTDKTKIKIILNYIDLYFDKIFSKYSFYSRNYNIFQFINFLRILPYCKNEKDSEFVLDALDKIYPFL